MATHIETAPKKYSKMVDVHKCHPYRNEILTIDNNSTAYITFAKILVVIVIDT